MGVHGASEEVEEKEEIDFPWIRMHVRVHTCHTYLLE